MSVRGGKAGKNEGFKDTVKETEVKMKVRGLGVRVMGLR